MTQSKREFFSKGVDNQSRPDIVIDLRRKDVKQIAKWNDRERHSALQFLEEAKKTFESFIEAIKNA